MPQSTLLKARGLYSFQNQLSAMPQGALLEAKNVVINRDDIIEPRRGYGIYGTAMTGGSTRAKQLLVYKDRILRHYGTVLDFDLDGAGTFSSFNGTFTEVEAGLRIKGLEANGNFYFTTKDGIKKISASTANELQLLSITNAGGIKALDGSAILNSQEGFFIQDSKVAYRIVWGIKDNNNNLILGVPSERIVITNSLISLLLNDYNGLLNQLDLETGVFGTGYFSELGLSTGSALGIKSGLIALGEKLDQNSIFVTPLGSTYQKTLTQTFSSTSSRATITFTGDVDNFIQPNDYVEVSGLTGTNSQFLNGIHRVYSTATHDKIEFDFFKGIDFSDIEGSASIRRIKYTIGQYRTNEGIEVPISSSSVAVRNNIAYITFGGTISNYILPEDQITLAGFTNVDINGSHKVIGIQTTTNPNDTIKISFINADVGPIAENNGTVFLEPATSTLPVSTVATTAQQEAIQDYYDTIVNDLKIEPNGFVNSTNYSNKNAIKSSTVDITFTVPSEITESYFYQVYRSALLTSTDVLSVNELAEPSDEMNLVFESNPSTSELIVKSITVNDIYPDDLRANSAYLYTSPNNGEGIAQSNELPPLAKDITLYKNQVFFGNTQTRQRNIVSLLSVSSFVADSSYIKIGNNTHIDQYTFSSTEDAALHRVRFQTDPDLSVAQQIDDCARSLVRVINKNSSSSIRAYYISGPEDVPGKIFFEQSSLSESKFVIFSNNDSVGAQFEKDISPLIISSSAASGGKTEVTTTKNHNLFTGDSVYIAGASPIPDGVYTVTTTSLTKFKIDLTFTSAASGGLVGVQFSDNEIAPNRLYYSKYQQPEAVPLLNYIDIGPKDKEIVRILGLRDSLFVIKEEAIYRLSGENSQFVLAPFDSSTQIRGADTACILNNQIYMDSNQGIASISETGVSIISRPIENLLLKLTNYTNFTTASFGVPYESDRSYYFFTITNSSDSISNQCFRYNTFTNTWSLFDISKTCGVVNPLDDKLYLGAGDTNYVEQERKSFSRIDYADREIIDSIIQGSLNGNVLKLGNTIDYNVGDVVVQTQYLTIFQFNRLLKQLDNDITVNDNDYSLLSASSGDNLRTKLTSLTIKLDADTGVSDSDYSSSISSYNGSFSEIQTAYNIITAKLNADNLVAYDNYPTSVGTVSYELDVIEKMLQEKQLVLRYSYPFIQGPISIFQHYECSVVWAPQIMEDPSILKHAREGTVLFEKDAFTAASVFYASDLSPDFEEIDFLGGGNGIWGSGDWGQFAFGGDGTGAPFRTLIPRSKQRCRYLKPKFLHAIARELFSIYGVSITYEITSTRGYR